MANYPQLDDQVGVWKLKDVNDAVMGGYWRVHGSRGLCAGGNPGYGDGLNVIDFVTLASAGNASDFGDIANGQSGTKGYATSSPTRFFYFSGNNDVANIEFGTIASLGNTTTFGDSTSIARRKSLTHEAGLPLNVA